MVQRIFVPIEFSPTSAGGHPHPEFLSSTVLPQFFRHCVDVGHRRRAFASLCSIVLVHTRREPLPVLYLFASL